jgi:hypothetical protein
MNYLIDPKKLYSTLADMEAEQRHTYMLIACMDMLSDRSSKHNWIVTTNPQEPAKKRAAKRNTYESCKGGYTQEFESFWNLYPRKIGKGAAYLAWKRIDLPKHELLMLCQLALAWQTISDQWKKDKGAFIPHPTTYINQRRWEDANENAGRKVETYMDMNGVVRERTV